MKRYRQTQRGGGLFSALEHEQAVARMTTGILKLRDLIAWERFRPLLEDLAGYAGRDWRKGGKPPFDPVLMFKVLVLQKFHGLSDDATEEHIFDRTSFASRLRNKNFLGLRTGDVIPDAKTLWDFKQRLEAEGREGSPAPAGWTPALWRRRASATAASKTRASKRGSGRGRARIAKGEARETAQQTLSSPPAGPSKKHPLSRGALLDFE